MTGDDESGAIATAGYFMELFSYTLRSGDLTEWKYVSGQTCKFCDNTTAFVEKTYEAGQHLSGRAVEVTDARVLAVDKQLGDYSVLVSYSLAAGSVLDASGANVRPLAEETGQLIIDVAPSVRGWVLMGGDSQ